VTVSVVWAVARAKLVTVVGLKAQDAPTGRNPEQLKAIDPLKAAFAVSVRVAEPVPPAGTEMVEGEDVIVKAGAGRVIA
jgi:hypothetical protein